MEESTTDLTQDLRKQLATQRQQLVEHYLGERDPQRYLAQHSLAVDHVLQQLWQQAGLDAAASLIAVGGYGRGQLFPCSDIDVLVLLPSPTPAELPERVAALISRMWDIGLEVGHSVRTIGECLQEAAADITIETNLLENRLIAGVAAPYQQLISRLDCQRDPLAFFEGKTLEQQQRHNRHFGVTNNLEPNIKTSTV